MKTIKKQSGLTLTETIAVVAAIALFVFLGVPAIKALFNSMEDESGTKMMVNAALSSARAMAMKEQRYVGIRFQHAYNRINFNDVLGTDQYMVFITFNSDISNLKYGYYYAIEGIEPIKLPRNTGVMDMVLGIATPSGLNGEIQDDTHISNPEQLRDTTTFSIIFSPAGKLSIQNIQVRCKNGDYQPMVRNDSSDNIFNGYDNIRNNNIGMFVQDDYSPYGLEMESSRNSFIIYDRMRLKQIQSNQRWTMYLQEFANKRIYISPYTGRIVSSE